MKQNNEELNEYIEFLPEGSSVRVHEQTLEVFLKADTPEKLDFKIIYATERVKKLCLWEETFDVAVRISYRIRNQEFTGSGLTLEEALSRVENKFPYKISKAVEKSYTARIKCSLTKMEQKKHNGLIAKIMTEQYKTPITHTGAQYIVRKEYNCPKEVKCLECKKQRKAKCRY